MDRRRRQHSIPACVALALTCGIASAGDSLSDCRSITGEAARLACYDALADRPAAPVAATEPAAQPAATAVSAAAPVAALPPPDPEDLFGRNSVDVVQRTTGSERLAQIRATVTGVQAGQFGKLILSLDNGQVWSQVDSPAGLRVNAGDDIHIRRAALNSYLLTLATGGGGAIRVRRIE